VEAGKFVAVARERTVGVRGALPAGVERLVEPDGDRVLAEESARALGADGPAAELDHLRRRRRQKRGGRPLLELAEVRFALAEQLGDGTPRSLLDDLV